MNTIKRNARNDEIVRMRLAGQSVQVIAIKYDMTRQSVYTVLNKAGVKAIPVIISAPVAEEKPAEVTE